MKLSELVDSAAWNEEIKKEFFLKLKRSPGNYNKAQNCIIKALNIAKSGTEYHTKEALILLDYVLNDLADNQHTLTHALSVQGIIYERYLKDYANAYESYTKWYEVGGSYIGYAFGRFRSYSHMTKFKFSKVLMDLYQDFLNEHHLPSKEIRFWTALGSSIMYSGAGAYQDAKRMAKQALEIAYEEEPTVLQRILKRHKISDTLDITGEEIKLVNNMVKLGKRGLFRIKRGEYYEN